MAGFDNDVVYGTNLDFSGAGGGLGGKATLVANGQLLIGRTTPNAGGTTIDVNTLTAGAGISITNAAGSITIAATGATASSFTEDTGSASPDGFGNVNIYGTSTQGISTSGSGSTVTLTNADWTTSQKGVGVLSTDAQAIAGSGTTEAVTPHALNAKLGTQTLHGLAIGAGSTNAIAWTAEPTNGQILIGSTGSAPTLGTITAGTGIGVTNAGGSITISSTDTAPTSFVTNSGTATPSANTIEIKGKPSTPITTESPGAGSGKTVQIDLGTVTPFFGGTGISNPTAHTLPIAEGASNFNFLGPLTNGELLIGSTGLDPVPATITAGAGISVTNGAGSISIATTSTLNTLSDDVATTVTPSGVNIQLVGHVVEAGATKFSTVTAGSHLLNINPMSCARWIVDPLGFNGTHTTIASAITSASSGDTIFIMPGTYTTDLTLKAGVNLTAQLGDSLTPNVTIIGKSTFTGSGQVCINNINLETNSDYILAVTGSSASNVILNNCYLSSTNNTAIDFTSSSSGSSITLNSCQGDLETTGITQFSMSSAGVLNINYSYLGNAGNSTTASTSSAGIINISYSGIGFPITTSGTNGFASSNTTHNPNGQNLTALTIGGSGSQNLTKCSILSGSASAISVSSTLSSYGSFIYSTNANNVTGAGTFISSGNFYHNLPGNNTTGYTQEYFDGGRYFGQQGSTTIPAGYIGEQIRSTIARGSPVTITTSNTATPLTSISLTAGVWDVSGVVIFTSVAITATASGASVNSSNSSMGTEGDNYVTSSSLPTSSADDGITIPSYRVVVSTTTIYYLNAIIVFTVGTPTAFGRISATRVA